MTPGDRHGERAREASLGEPPSEVNRVGSEGQLSKAGGVASGSLREPSYKRALDLGVFFLAHLLLLPLWAFLWLVIPLAIVLDDGPPVFYRQKRLGKGGRVFEALKFRTMIRNADSLGPAWTARNDPRLTRVGRILRGTALDEMPQLLSILRGDMSFIGPRPLTEAEVAYLQERVPGFQRRLALRPGLTGLAQVYTDREDAQEKLAYDLQYAQRMSLWLDVKLLFLSVWVTLRGKWESRGKKV